MDEAVNEIKNLYVFSDQTKEEAKKLFLQAEKNQKVSEYSEEYLKHREKLAVENCKKKIGYDINCPILTDISDLTQELNKIFYPHMTIDEALIIKGVAEKCNLKVGKKNGNITINGSETKFSLENINGAYQGLCGLVSQEYAKRIIIKILTNKISKVF